MQYRDDMAFGGPESHSTVMLEAEQVIRKWLRDVERANREESDDLLPCTHRAPPSPLSPPDTQLNKDNGPKDGDFLSSLDWGESVADNARTVMEKLLKKDLCNSGLRSHSNSIQSNDPRIAMEMRHKQVRERRKLRDQKRRQQMESELMLKQAQKEAEEVVRREEMLAREKAIMEEKLINQQVMLIRSQLKEQQKASQRIATEQRAAFKRELSYSSTKHKGRHGRLDCAIEANPLILKAEEIIKSEKRRQQTRSELIRQLEEAEVYEAKEDIKLIHRYFSLWYETVAEQRAKVGKAIAVRDWKLMMRMWGVWKRFVIHRRARRERDEATREMQRLEREFKMALKHYENHLLLRTLDVWRSTTRLSKTQRKLLEEKDIRRKKIQTILEAATLKAKELQRSERETCNLLQPKPQNNVPQQSKHINKVVSTPGKKKLPVPKAPRTPEPALWQVANKQLTRLISEVNDIALEATEDNDSQQVPPHGSTDFESSRELKSNNIQDSVSSMPFQLHPKPQNSPNRGTKKRLKPKPVTKPMAMTGMAKRTAAIAERKVAREQRREVLLKERAKQVAKEEEEKRKAELAAREALIQKRREEKRLVKQKELEKLKRQKQQLELNLKATRHYRLKLLHKRGLVPWKTFVEYCRANKESADLLNVHLLQRTMFRQWKNHWKVIMSKKEERSQQLYSRILLRRTWSAWTKSVVWSHQLEEFAVEVYPHLLMKYTFLGWWRVTKEELTDQWEKLARARLFRQRSILRQVLKVWFGYIPIAKEERAKEGRRAELRRKVSSWLSDFEPHPPYILH